MDPFQGQVPNLGFMYSFPEEGPQYGIHFALHRLPKPESILLQEHLWETQPLFSFKILKRIRNTSGCEGCGIAMLSPPRAPNLKFAGRSTSPDNTKGISNDM